MGLQNLDMTVYIYIYIYMGVPGSSVVKNPSANAGDTDPWVRKIPGEGNDNPF